MGACFSFPGNKVVGGLILATHFILISRRKNEWRYKFTPPIRLHDVYKDIFTVYGVRTGSGVEATG